MKHKAGCFAAVLTRIVVFFAMLLSVVAFPSTQKPANTSGSAVSLGKNFSGVFLSIPNPTREFYVNDFANILSEKTKNTIYRHSIEFYKLTRSQVVFVTVSSLDGKEVSDYALELGRKWGVGSKDKNNGLVVLISPNDGKVAISVGRGLEGRINDAKAGKLLDECAMEDFKAKNWNDGVMKLFSPLLEEILNEYSDEEIDKNKKEGVLPPKEENILDKAGSIFKKIMYVVILIFAVIALVTIIFDKRVDKRGKRELFFLLLANLASVLSAESNRRNDNNSNSGKNSGGGGGFGGGGAAR
ncbi:MAG: TPM domain-containing protein [Oscillospiraceae bacterium]|jgi:uncharacterized protein|nr:TPM domain-containing protein [Oscillospiraceae bacterium]